MDKSVEKCVNMLDNFKDYVKDQIEIIEDDKDIAKGLRLLDERLAELFIEFEDELLESR